MAGNAWTYSSLLEEQNNEQPLHMALSSPEPVKYLLRNMSEKSPGSMGFSSCELFQFIVCTVIIGTLCILGITGNIVSALVLQKHRTDTSTVYLLQVLAFTDSLLLLCSFFIYCVHSMYPMLPAIKSYTENYDIVREYIWPFSLMAHTATVWMTVLVTLNRFSAVCRPLGLLRGYSGEVTRVQVFVILSASILYNIPRFFEHQPISYETKPTSNGTNETQQVFLGDNKLYQIIYSNVFYFPIMYIIPLLSLSFLNYKLITALNIIKRRRESLTGHRAREDHITMVVIVIVIVFILCQTPALINQIFWASFGNTLNKCGQFHFYYTKLSDVLVVLNSSVNFAIYCLFGKTFRSIFVEALCSKKRSLKPSTLILHPLTEDQIVETQT